MTELQHHRKVAVDHKWGTLTLHHYIIHWPFRCGYDRPTTRMLRGLHAAQAFLIPRPNCSHLIVPDAVTTGVARLRARGTFVARRLTTFCKDHATKAELRKPTTRLMHISTRRQACLLAAEHHTARRLAYCANYERSWH